MNSNEEMAVVKAYYRVIENLEIIQTFQVDEWSKKILEEAKLNLKKFRGY